MPGTGRAGTAPWASDIRPILEDSYRHLPEGRFIAELITSSLAVNTYDSYGTGWRRFVAYMQRRGRHPLRGNEQDVADYLVALAREGTVKLKSCQPYLSAINRAYADAGLPRIALGPLVQSVRAGLSNRQFNLDPDESRRALPAEIALAWFDRAILIDFEASDETARNRDLVLARNLLASLLLYVTGSRPSSIRRLEIEAISILTCGSVQLIRNYVKGQNDSDDHDVVGRRPIKLPYAQLAAQLKAFDAARRAARPTAHFFFELSANDHAVAASARWFTGALDAVRVAPADRVNLSPGSGRSGFASGANAVGVVLPKIKYIGGWALNSTTVEKHYIDPTYPDTPAARYFFEYLVTGQRPAARVNMGQG